MRSAIRPNAGRILVLAIQVGYYSQSMHYERTPCFTRLKPRVALAAHQNQNG